MAARLKVFVTSDGLTDYAVAASSRAKALAAWGVRQDLFKEGSARETDDETVRAAALAQPGEVLRRPSGGRAALARLKPVAKPKPKTPSKAALRKVASLKQQLSATDAEHEAALARIEAARSRLAGEEARARATHEAKRSKIEAALAAAREALTA